MKLATLCYVKRPGQALLPHRVKKAGGKLFARKAQKEGTP